MHKTQSAQPLHDLRLGVQSGCPSVHAVEGDRMWRMVLGGAAGVQ